MVRRAHAAGVVAIALTDHDTVDGVTEAVAEGQRLGLRVVSGCEFSVRVAWGEMHLLGYFLPLGDGAIERFLATARRQRLDRARLIVEHLQAWGVDITPEEVLAEAGNAAVGRPHVARALVRLGKVSNVTAAFDEFLGQGRRAYVEKVLPSLAEVAHLVHRAGGIVSAAHLRDRASRTMLEMLRADGLDGVEVRHPSHSPDMAAHIGAVAERLGLLRTGGSDWHGDAAAEAQAPIGAGNVPLEWLQEMDARRPAPTPDGTDASAPAL